MGPSIKTVDIWYGKKETLNFFKDKEQSFVFALKSNRKISLFKNKEVQLKELEIPDVGLIVYLKEVGLVKIFVKKFKNEFRYYAMWLAEEEKLEKITRETFELIHNQHWGIEQYHRTLKQGSNIEGFQEGIKGMEGGGNFFFGKIKHRSDYRPPPCPCPLPQKHYGS